MYINIRTLKHTLIHSQTHTFTGADLANLINQAALHGSAAGNVAVTTDDIDYARDKIIMGPERKSAVIEEQNRKLVAYHESGHAIVALYTPGELTTAIVCKTMQHKFVVYNKSNRVTATLYS